MRRVGVACPGDPNHPTTWSGTPSGVIEGLSDAGATPIAINVEPHPLVRKLAVAVVALAYLRPSRDFRSAMFASREAARASRPVTALQSITARRRLRQAGHLDGLIQIGTGFELLTQVPIVTLEDMTVRQTRTHPYSGWDLLSQKTFNVRVERQRRAYETAVACCVMSRWAAESVVTDYGIDPQKVHVVGVGRNHQTVCSGGRDWKTPRFLFVGLDWERKNGVGVLRAFSRLRAEVPTATLDLVGGHPALNEPGVRTHGVLRLDVSKEREHLSQLFAESTCFVMPSISEAVGIAYVEAAANGLPSIGTSQGGSDFLIGDGGLIVDPTDDEALYTAMRRLADPETAAEMGSAALRRSEMFTWEAVARRLLRAVEGKPAELPLVGPIGSADENA
ncbi:glycosyltransferase family 4 protein [Gordonia sp. CPCC 205515]|uniref:glycosyltransferase family 4 protein n=1 Tax=Gordonia sp. CPCC 205515 TaxID=3140791 RepID=UPI003AF3E48A